jgi:SM-20-related protein
VSGNCAAVDAEGARGFGDLVGELRAGGVAVRDRFLSSLEVRALAGCINARRERGDFVEARVGADRHLQRRAEIRGDSICWLTDPEFAAEFELLVLLEGLRLRLNRDAVLGLFDTELHYAWYPPGAQYARHVDQPLGRNQRRVSLALYLNERWAPSNGGVLRIFDDDDRHRDIEPMGGRLVLFLTERRGHAVMPARRDRLSLSGWFRSRE